MSEQAARMRFVTEMAKLTVWIRQCHDGRWEAIDWYGKLITTGRYRASVEHEVRQVASIEVNCIYATAVIIDPKDRQSKRKPKGMRRVNHV